jgi:hypothetical protein
MAGSEHAQSVEVQLLRLPYVGFVSKRRLYAVMGTVSLFVLTTAVVATLPLTPVYVQVMLFALAACVALSFFGLGLVISQQITVWCDQDLFVAEDTRTGLIRHGETPYEATERLDRAIDLYNRRPD